MPLNSTRLDATELNATAATSSPDWGRTREVRVTSRSRVRFDFSARAARRDFETMLCKRACGSMPFGREPNADATVRNGRLQDATTQRTQRLLDPIRGTELGACDFETPPTPASTPTRRKLTDTTCRGVSSRFGTDANFDIPDLLTHTHSRPPVRFVFRERVVLNRHIKARNGRVNGCAEVFN